MSTQFHSFKERNAWSLAAKQEAFWEAIYQKAFPSLVKCEPVTDRALQLQGVDRLLTLSNGITLTIDEKARERFYSNDILIEYRHEGEYNAPGWIEKDLTIDYLAVGYVPSRRCYLFDWRMLRRAWIHYKDAWMPKYEHKSAKNDNGRYTTWSLIVPTAELQRAVTTASVIEVDQF